VYRDIIIDAFKYAQQHKGLKIHAYVIMTNHIHCILSADEGKKLSNIIRDFKSYTAHSIIEQIIQGPESRREWLLPIFQKIDPLYPNKSINRFWTEDNHPIELITNTFKDQKLDYIHQNPVRAGWVQKAEDWTYSSAVDYAGGQGLLPIEFL
jgi:REP element-mobilizing transposase RayT